MVTVENQTYSFDVSVQPGKHWPASLCRELVKELRACAAASLSPLPDYQCLSFAPNALDDKLLVIVRQGAPPNKIVAFTSSILLDMPFLNGLDMCTTVLHAGLACVLPELRGSNLTIQMTYYAWYYMAQEHPEGLWLTNVAEVISSLGYFAIYTHNCFPHPSTSKPLDIQVRIAQEISLHHRARMAISPDAIFDPTTFVFKGSNPSGSCFRKDTEDKRFHHRRNRETEYFKALLGRNEGNEVLQVGFMSLELLFRILAVHKQKSVLVNHQLLATRITSDAQL